MRNGWEEFRIVVAKQTMSRQLRAMNDRKLSAQPRLHAQPSDTKDFPISRGVVA